MHLKSFSTRSIPTAHGIAKDHLILSSPDIDFDKKMMCWLNENQACTIPTFQMFRSGSQSISFHVS